MSTTPDPTSTPGPGVPDPQRPASDPDIQPSTPGAPPGSPADPNVEPAPQTEPDVDQVAHEQAPGPEETAQGLQTQPAPTEPNADDPGSMLNY